MHTLKTTKIVSAAIISLILSACGGGTGGSPLDPQTSNSGNSNSSSSSVDTTTPTFIGFGFDTSFAPGQIGVSIGDATLSPGGSTNLTVNIVSSTKTLASSPIDIIFNSPCIASGEAKLSVNNVAVTGNKVTSNFGEATVTYTANGCTDSDQVTATAVLKGAPAVAKTTLNIAADKVGSIQAIAPSTSTQISLKGTGGKETAVVTFLVSGETNAPIKNIDVDFTLSNTAGGTSLGGLSLVNTSATSDKNGLVSTTVQAGTVATSVVVTAKIRGTNIATTSNKLTASTGIPDQDSFSIAASDLYPVSWDHLNIESSITVSLGDAFSNPAVNGTAVSFTAESGLIDPSCVTTNGTCQVKWRSQSQGPVRDSSNFSVARMLCVDPLGNSLDANNYPTCRRERAGRVTILAHAIGNESFIDNNGNGLYDKDDTAPNPDTFKTHDDYPFYNPECDKAAPLSSFARPSGSPFSACDDLVEAYLDRNENGIRDNDEIFIDLNLDGAYSVENRIYNGALCQDKDELLGLCTNKEKVTIRAEQTLVMVSDHQMLENYSYRYDGATISTDRFPFLTRVVYLDAVSKASSSAASSGASSSTGSTPLTTTNAFFWLADINGNGAPAGTTIEIDTGGLKNADAQLTNKGPLPGSADPTRIGIRFSADDSGNPPYGFVRISVTFPVPGGELIRTDVVDVNDMKYGK